MVDIKEVKFVILCPVGSRTGGPEALYQLTDMLNKLGFLAQMWHVTNEDILFMLSSIQNGKSISSMSISIEERNCDIEEYNQYIAPPFISKTVNDGIVFILPEVFAKLIHFFNGVSVVLWWLSVDNLLKRIDGLNLNYLRRSNIRHIAQSAYAVNVARAIGINSMLVSDYTVVEEKYKYFDKKNMVCFNAGSKIIYDLDSIVSKLILLNPNVDVRMIVGMSRADVYSTISSSRLYVDFGNFPGKDRMPREALLFNTNILLSNSGSADYDDDFPIDKRYKLNPDDHVNVVATINNMLNNYDAHVPFFKRAKDNVDSEYLNFSNEVMSFAMSYF